MIYVLKSIISIHIFQIVRENISECCDVWWGEKIKLFSLNYTWNLNFHSVMNIDKTFYATPNFPSSDCSYDEQFWQLSLHPVEHTSLSLPVRIPARVNMLKNRTLKWHLTKILLLIFPFWVFALWNVNPSRPLSPCSWLESPNLSCCVRLFLSIYNCSPPVFMRPLTNNLVDLYIGSRETNCLTVTWIYFPSNFNRPLLQPVQNFL